MNNIILGILQYVVGKILTSQVTADMKDLVLRNIRELINAQFSVVYRDLKINGVVITAGDQRRLAVRKELAEAKGELGNAIRALSPGLINFAIEALIILINKK